VSKFVPEALRAAAGIYEERNKLYGSNYKKFGHVVAPMLAGIHVESPDDFNRLGILIQMLSKITRYCENFERGGHADSLDDLAVYAMMLRELDADVQQMSREEIEVTTHEDAEPRFIKQ
jgi:hypothetical protein